MRDTVIFERGDLLYLVAPVAPLDLEGANLEELAFATELKKMAPNELLGWLRGQYVEADRPNKNGHEWSVGTLEIASLTPMLMPVTVMHDPRTAVGMIADARLLAADGAQVPRARIDTTLGIWRHRFPETWEEATANYTQGTLMQSMECRPAYYDCGECGLRYPRLPGKAEEKNWCEHLRGETAASGEKPVRRLGGVTFTGTGLIFGTRGARGALDTAHLDVFQDEVAEFHDRAKHDRKPSRRQPRMDKIEIDRSEYDALKAKAAKSDELASRVAELEPKVDEVAALTKANEKLEVEKKAAEDEATKEKTAREALEETARTATLASDRLDKLGTAFKAKLPKSVSDRLEDQAKSLDDEAWTQRLDELADMLGVKSDAAAVETDAVFTPDETARAGFTGGDAPKVVSDIARKTTVGGLMNVLSKKPTKAAA